MPANDECPRGPSALENPVDSVRSDIALSRFLLLLLLWVCGRVPQRRGKEFSNELNTEPWHEAAQEMMVGPSGPEFWGEVQPLASLKGLDIPSRRAVFVPWKPSRRPAFGMGNPTFR